MRARRYASHRRAWTPRLWPVALASLGLSFAAWWLLAPSWWLSAPIGGLAGFAVGHARWVVWRRRHPQISVQEMVADMRRAAPWN